MKITVTHFLELDRVQIAHHVSVASHGVYECESYELESILKHIGSLMASHHGRTTLTYSDSDAYELPDRGDNDPR